MKRLLPVALVCAALSLTGWAAVEMSNGGPAKTPPPAAAAPAGATAPGGIGRFKVVAVPSSNGGMAAAIKIDTVTGETWSTFISPVPSPAAPAPISLWRKTVN